MQPVRLLTAHARAGAGISRHAGVTAATGVAFQPDEMVFDRGLTEVLLGVPHRVLQTDARSRLLGSSAGLRGVVETHGDPRSLEQLVLIDARQPYRVGYARERAPAIDFLYLSPAWLATLASEMTGRPVDRVTLRSDLRLVDAPLGAVARHFVALATARLNAPAPGALWRDSVRHLLGVTLLARHADGLPRQRVRTRPLALTTLRRIEDVIAARMSSDLSLGELAAQARLSPHQFLRSFRRATGVTPHRYVLGRRVEEAARLLRTTTRPITDIAAETGFSSQTHLSQAFRALRRMTPRQYRALHGRRRDAS